MTTPQKTSEGSPRNKKFTVRVTVTNFDEIRERVDQAWRTFGPAVYKWIRVTLFAHGPVSRN